MKNFKKLSRGEMKTIGGGEWGGFACCNFKGECSAVAIGNSDNMRCVDYGTFLKKIENIKEANTGLSQSID